LSDQGATDTSIRFYEDDKFPLPICHTPNTMGLLLVEEEYADNPPVNTDSINYIRIFFIAHNSVLKAHAQIPLHCSPPRNTLCHSRRELKT